MFVNRVNEIRRISELSSNLMVVFGRRRVGKTVLIKNALGNSKSKVFYSQALEASEKIQVEQVREDTSPLLPDVEINSWIDFLKFYLALIRQF